MPSKARAIVALMFFTAGDAFVPGFSRNRLMPIVRRAEDDKPQVVSLSEIVSEDVQITSPAWIKHQADQKGIAQKSSNGINPDNYEGFIDVEGFDGGDGQVGVVGSDELEGVKEGTEFQTLETVEKKESQARKVQGESVGGSESKKKQRVAFGYATGYADKLIAEQGMDSAKAQQLENWQNQQAQKALTTQARQEFAETTGVVYDSRRATESYFEALAAGDNDDAKFTMIKGDTKDAKATKLAQGLAKGAVTQAFEMKSQFPRPSFLEIDVKNDVMSYEDFVVGFSEDSDATDFQVTPLDGTLNRRGGDPTTLAVTFVPNSPGGDRNVWIVVKTEESTFTYHVTGHVM